MLQPFAPTKTISQTVKAHSLLQQKEGRRFFSSSSHYKLFFSTHSSSSSSLNVNLGYSTISWTNLPSPLASQRKQQHSNIEYVILNIQKKSIKKQALFIPHFNIIIQRNIIFFLYFVFQSSNIRFFCSVETIFLFKNKN